MNKKGDIPVTILVFGVFAICTLAILSFHFSNKKENISGVGLIEGVNAIAEKIRFYQEVNLSPENYLDNVTRFDDIYIIELKDDYGNSVKYELPVEKS